MAAPRYFIERAQESCVADCALVTEQICHEWHDTWIVVSRSKLPGRASVWMDGPFELVGALFVIALSAVVLVGGELYLAKQIEPNSETSASRPYLAENTALIRSER